MPPEEIAEQYFNPPCRTMSASSTIRSRTVKKELESLDVHKAIGHYSVGATRILKEFASELATPIAVLCRKILQEACWPKRWKLHNLSPIYKRSSVYKAKNYRGVHVTCNISKIAEKVIGNPLVTFLQQFGFGTHSGHSGNNLVREIF